MKVYVPIIGFVVASGSKPRTDVVVHVGVPDEVKQVTVRSHVSCGITAGAAVEHMTGVVIGKEGM